MISIEDWGGVSGREALEGGDIVPLFMNSPGKNTGVGSCSLLQGHTY